MIKKLTKQLIQCESVHLKPEEITKTADVFAKFFGHTVEQHDSKNKKILTTLFVPKGIKMPKVLFLGHMDVASTSKNAFYMKEDGDRLFGRGVYDMKGPTAALAVAMKNILTRNPQASVGLLITGDEERGGMEGVGSFVKEHERQLPEVVFNPDGGSAFTLVTEEKGVLFVEVEVFGKSSHASRPWEGKNAIVRAAEGILELQKCFPKSHNNKSWKTTVTPTVISGGASGNQVPNSVLIRIDIRFIPSDTKKDLLLRVKKCFRGDTVRVLKEAEPFKFSTNPEIVRSLQMCARSILGNSLPRERYHSSCDARFFAALQIPVIIMRPLGGGAHSDNEWISLKGLEKYAKIIEQYVETRKN